MALSANREIDRYVDQQLRSLDLAGGVHVYKGALLEINDAGYVRPATGAGTFAGIAYEEADNTAGDDGDLTVRAYTQGDFDLPVAGLVAADVGRPIYAAADDLLTFAAQSTTPVGHVLSLSTAGRAVIRLADSSRTPGAKLEGKSTSFAITSRQSGAVFTNLGATGTITATLPASPLAGTSLRFVCVADQEFRIAPGPSSGIYIKGAKQADGKYVAISDIGDFIHLVADQNSDWVSVASINGADADITVEA